MLQRIWVTLILLSPPLYAGPLEEAAALRKAIEAPKVPALFSIGELDESFKLNVQPVFGQGPTQFCWAYSAYHTLKTYYLNTTGSDEKWKSFFDQFNSTSEYKSYVLSQVGSTSVAGWPNEAVMFYEKTIGSKPGEEWTSFVPSETESGWKPHPGPDLHSYTPQAFFLTKEALTEKIHAAFLKGAPTAFCTTTHCVSIFGAEYVNGSALRYEIADSAGGNTYTADAKSVHAKIADITTLW